MRFAQRWSALAVFATCLAACSGGGGGYTTSPNDNNPPSNNPPSGTALKVMNNRYSPSALSVTAGQTVTWTWDTCSTDPYGGSDACVTHSVLFDDGAASEVQSTGTYSRTFANKGTFPYHCTIHGTAMSGSIIVQ